MLKKHGRSKTRIYRIWSSMKNRCLNPSEPCFRYYGGRGISLCESWHSFENFYRDMGEGAPGMQLDRVDNGKGYSKENCRWTTQVVNANNKRSNHPLTHNGQTKNLGQWAAEVGVTYGALLYRLKRGWGIEQVLGFKAAPPRCSRKARKLLVGGELKTFKQLSTEFGVGISTLKQRFYVLGWSIEDIAGDRRHER